MQEIWACGLFPPRESSIRWPFVFSGHPPSWISLLLTHFRLCCSCPLTVFLSRTPCGQEQCLMTHYSDIYELKRYSTSMVSPMCQALVMLRTFYSAWHTGTHNECLRHWIQASIWFDWLLVKDLHSHVRKSQSVKFLQTGCLDQPFYACGPRTNTIDITWELVRNTESEAPPWPTELESVS